MNSHQVCFLCVHFCFVCCVWFLEVCHLLRATGQSYWDVESDRISKTITVEKGRRNSLRKHLQSQGSPTQVECLGERSQAKESGEAQKWLSDTLPKC